MKKAATSKKQSPTSRSIKKTTTNATGKQSFFVKQRHKISAFLQRRPHRSFRRTRRRDYVRSLKLPGYFAFTFEVISVMKRYKWIFIRLVASFSVITVLFAGVASQETYRQLSDVLNDTSQDVLSGAWGEVGKAGLLLTTSLNGTFRNDMTEVQQVYAFLVVIFIWLTTVLFLRTVFASSSVPKLRTIVYSAGAPIVPTAIISLVLLFQLIPAALAVIAYSAALSTDFLSNPLISVVFFIIFVTLILLSIYLLISTFFAMVVVTLPGMYPWQAIRTAGDMVIGRRLRILYRVIWMVFVVLVLAFVVMVPIIVLTNWLQSSISQIEQLPIIPFALVVLSTAITVFISCYVYLLYRKVLDDDAAPA